MGARRLDRIHGAAGHDRQRGAMDSVRLQRQRQDGARASAARRPNGARRTGSRRASKVGARAQAPGCLRIRRRRSRGRSRAAAAAAAARGRRGRDGGRLRHREGGDPAARYLRGCRAVVVQRRAPRQRRRERDQDGHARSTRRKVRDEDLLAVDALHLGHRRRASRPPERPVPDPARPRGGRHSWRRRLRSAHRGIRRGRRRVRSLGARHRRRGAVHRRTQRLRGRRRARLAPGEGRRPARARRAR